MAYSEDSVVVEHSRVLLLRSRSMYVLGVLLYTLYGVIPMSHSAQHIYIYTRLTVHGTTSRKDAISQILANYFVDKVIHK
jgi:hypothetical protein